MDLNTAVGLQMTWRATMWLLLLAIHGNITHSATLSDILSLACSSICKHGVCRYQLLAGLRVTLRCECHPGWSGEQCSLPCTHRCPQRRCFLVGNRNTCLCPQGISGVDCFLPDSATVISPASANSATLTDSGNQLFRASHSKGTVKVSTRVLLPEHISAGISRHIRVATVQNPREQVERNVELGAHQCTGNFVCRNGGKCVRGEFGGYRCQCLTPFTGTFCQTACLKPCMNGGVCVKVPEQPQSPPTRSSPPHPPPVRPYTYKCNCPLTFTGELCQTRLEEMNP